MKKFTKSLLTGIVALSLLAPVAISAVGHQIHVTASAFRQGYAKKGFRAQRVIFGNSKHPDRAYPEKGDYHWVKKGSLIDTYGHQGRYDIGNITNAMGSYLLPKKNILRHKIRSHKRTAKRSLKHDVVYVDRGTKNRTVKRIDRNKKLIRKYRRLMKHSRRPAKRYYRRAINKLNTGIKRMNRQLNK